MAEVLSTGRWQLNGAFAKLSCGALEAEIDVRQPHVGLANIHLNGQLLDGRLMAVDVIDEAGNAAASDRMWQPADVFARGCDLVATYHEPFGQPFNLQIYWRSVTPTAQQSAALEAIISIQTRQWEAYPRATVATTLQAIEVAQANGSVIYRCHGDRSYIETTLPGDFTIGEADVTPAGLRRAVWRYENHFMERGVIRRLRLRGAFVPRVGDEAAADALSRWLVSDQPPLTA